MITNKTSLKPKSKQLEENITQTISQDITGMFEQSKGEDQKTKDKQTKDKNDYLERSKTNKQYHNKEEAEMLRKEGLSVTGVDETSTKKQGLFEITDMLGAGSIKADAKGLNNNKNSILIYFSQNSNLALQFDSAYMGRDGNVRPTTGSYGQQRFCFDNNTNQIKLAYGGDCSQVYNLCLDNYGGQFRRGDRVVVWECHSGWSEKWFFDEEGRLALLGRPDLCLDSYG